jgi:hypothetical protein
LDLREAAKQQARAREQQRVTYSDGLARGNLIAAQQSAEAVQESAKAAKIAAWAALAAAAGSIGALIVAIMK